MEIISGQNIATSVKDICPKKIAVAFVGTDYSSFLDESCIKNLECIILSPTEGSNPHAISDLIKKIGWDRIFFLSRLHAKIYIGEKESIIGSANLSRNGLIGDETGLFETCVRVESNNQVIQIFNSILIQAKKQFPNVKAKQKALQSLFEVHNRRVSGKLEKAYGTDQNFLNYDWNFGEHFYITWFTQSNYGGYTENTKRLCMIDNENSIEDDMAFTEDDPIKKNKWILCWKCCSNEDRIDRRSNLSWVYIDEIVSNGWEDEIYKKLAVQLKIRSQHRPKPPFVITQEFTQAFRKTIDKEKYSILFSHPYIASSPDIAKVMSDFLADVKENMRKSNRGE